MESANTPSPPTATKPRWRRVLTAALCAVGILVAALGALVVLWFRHLDRVHQHCIVQAGIAFRLYAADHDGWMPFHTNGFGDALLLLVKAKYLENVRCVCGPGDDGRALSEDLNAGSDVAESNCSRVYVQGLGPTNDARICSLPPTLQLLRPAGRRGRRIHRRMFPKGHCPSLSVPAGCRP